MKKTYIVRNKRTSAIQIVMNYEDIVSSTQPPTIITNQDSQFKRTTSSSVTRKFKLEVLNALSDYEINIPDMTNLIYEDGQYVSTGNGGTKTITVTDGVSSSSVNMTPYYVASSTVDVWNSYLAGSLGAHITEQITSRVLPGKSMNRLSVYDPINEIYTPNPDFWLNDIDLTCIPVHNSVTGRRFLGCLITPQHVLVSSHAAPPVGSRYTFLTTLGTKATFTVHGIVKYSQNSDLSIIGLGGSIPNVTPCKLFGVPGNKYRNIRSLCIAGNQHGEMLIHMSLGNLRTHKPVDTTIFPSPVGMENLTKKLVSGDSGSPLMYIINGEPALIGTHYTASATNDVPQNWTSLETIGAPGSVQPITNPDYSSFPTY